MFEELKPCPFCGGEARINKSSNVWYIECGKCNAFMGSRNLSWSASKGDLSFDNEGDCIKAWNRRAAVNER